MFKSRVISAFVSLIFILGSIQFFIINGIKFILLIKGQTVTTAFFNGAGHFFEFCEMLTPLTAGFFLIYMVYRLGFIGEDEEEELANEY